MRRLKTVNRKGKRAERHEAQSASQPKGGSKAGDMSKTRSARKAS